MLKIRTHLVNFRVTEEEYVRLKTASAQQGARCLSDFARAAMLAAVENPDRAADYVQPFHAKLRAFDRRLSALEEHFTRISALTPVEAGD